MNIELCDGQEHWGTRLEYYRLNMKCPISAHVLRSCSLLMVVFGWVVNCLGSGNGGSGHRCSDMLQQQHKDLLIY